MFSFKIIKTHKKWNQSYQCFLQPIFVKTLDIHLLNYCFFVSATCLHLIILATPLLLSAIHLLPADSACKVSGVLKLTCYSYSPATKQISKQLYSPQCVCYRSSRYYFSFRRSQRFHALSLYDCVRNFMRRLAKKNVLSLLRDNNVYECWCNSVPLQQESHLGFRSNNYLHGAVLCCFVPYFRLVIVLIHLGKSSFLILGMYVCQIISNLYLPRISFILHFFSCEGVLKSLAIFVCKWKILHTMVNLHQVFLFSFVAHY